jgi:hypothetical protein
VDPVRTRKCLVDVQQSGYPTILTLNVFLGGSLPG